MKKILLSLLLVISTGIFAQTAQYLQGPDGYGLTAPYTDKGLIPVYTDGNYLYAVTIKKDPAPGNMPRNYLVRVDMTNDSMYVYANVQLSGTADFYGPRQFTSHGNYIFFNCGWRLYRLDKTTNTITEYLADCDHYYIIGDYMIYDYWNSSKTYSRNMVTNVTTEIKAPDDKSIITIGSIYEYNNEIYFWATVSSFSTRKNGIFKYNPITKVLNSFMYVTLPSGNSNMYQSVFHMVRVNDNLVYLIKDTNYNYKFVSVNLTSQALNTSFTFDMQSVYGASEPFVVNNQVFLSRGENTFVSDGVATPVISPIGGFRSYFGNLNKNYMYLNGNVFAVAEGTPPTGRDIRKTDGTVAGTELVATLTAGLGGTIYASGAIVHNGTIYFSTLDGSTVATLYRTDGTSQGTHRLTLPGLFTSITNLKGFEDHIYFYGKKNNGPAGLYKININQPPAPSVCGEIFNDINGDGIADWNEPGISGVNVTIISAPASFPYPLPYTTSSGSTGSYCFTDLDNGTYTFQVEVPEGWEAGSSFSPIYNVTIPVLNYGNTYKTGLRPALSTADIEKSGFLVYPNPATTTVDIIAENYSGTTLTLFDMSGKQLHTQTLSGNITRMDVGNLASGVYLLKLISLEKSYTQKLIIK